MTRMKVFATTLELRSHIGFREGETIRYHAAQRTALVPAGTVLPAELEVYRVGEPIPDGPAAHVLVRAMEAELATPDGIRRASGAVVI